MSSFLRGHNNDLFVPTIQTPGQVAELLSLDELDIGLIPSIELQRIPGLEVVPDLCVSARGAAIRVELRHPGSIERIETVAVPRASRSAVALMHIVLREVFELDPKVVPLHRGRKPPKGIDARLLIGDGTLEAPSAGEVSVDIGLAWQRLTGRPFVFALWAVRSHVELPQLPLYFKSGLRYGLSSLEQLAREAAAEHGCDLATAERYLRDELCYVLGPDELAGLEEFYERAHAFGLAPGPRPLVFWDR